MIVRLAARARHRSRLGQAMVEFILVFGIWALALIFLANVAIIFANISIMQNQLDRATMQAAGEGCLDPAVVQHFAADTSLAKSNIVLVARQEATSPGRFTFDPTQASADTLCPANGGRDVVPSGYWIDVTLTYHQHLLGVGSLFHFPSYTVTRSSLVVSNALQQGSS